MGKYYLGMEKKMQIQTPVIFDTDCLSSFLWIRRMIRRKNVPVEKKERGQTFINIPMVGGN